jgi:serine/threonine-protein kinase
MVGQTISHYKVLEKIGEGGMGEVYRATDTKLNRDVALKILPEQFASDTQRMGRFQREAEVLASLDHPNIGQIYGIEEAGQTKALVLQLIEGPTLAERIAQGPIPVEDALKIALQMAEGLEAAHEKGVIHRDLKPANIKITPEGQVKILDFGLAKAMEAEAPDSSLSQSPTLTHAATQAGVILGTAAYMSPEQARGQPVDKRADIFAFGCVLYECLTGKRLFDGPTVSDTLASVLKTEPDWSLLPDEVPPSIRRLLRRCLRKDRRDRLHDVADARIELREAPEGTQSSEDTAATEGRRAPAWWIPAALGLAGIAGWLLAGWAIIRTDTRLDTQGVTQFEIELPVEQQIVSSVTASMLKISRDGRRIAWVGNGRDGLLAYTRALDSLEVHALEGTRGLNGIGGLAISPDGRWLAFLRDGSLWKIPVEGGVATPLVDIRETGSQIETFDWGEGDKIVMTLSSALYLLDINGGPAVQLTTLDAENREFSHGNPLFLPGDRAVVFANCMGNFNNCRLEAVSLDSSERSVLVDEAWTGSGTLSGHLVFGRGETIFAVPFDAERLKVTGGETPVLSPVQFEGFGRVPSFATAPNGTMAYTPGGQGILQRRIAWIGRDGEVQPLPVPPGRYKEPDLSPDGTRLLITQMSGHDGRIYTYDFERNLFTQASEGHSYGALWSPDADRIAFTDSGGISIKPMRSGGEIEPLLDGTELRRLWDWSNDDRFLAYSEWDSKEQQYDLWLLPLDPDNRQPILLANTFDNETHARLAPNGRWIAYMSQEEGRPEIFVQEIGPDGSRGDIRRKVSREGGWEPEWAPDGTELLFRSLDGSSLLGVSVDPDTLEIGQQEVVLHDVSFPASDHWGEASLYEVSPDGEKFLVLQDVGPERAKLVVVEHWLEELERLVPTDN